MNIREAIDDEALFGRFFRDGETWKAWRVVLSALFALPMAAEELALYTQCTGRTIAPSKPFDEAWLIVGRRGGKSRTLSLIAVYLATFIDWRPYLAPGERGYIPVIAADRKQARTIMGYIRAMIDQTPMIAEFVAKDNSEEIQLSNDITIEVATCSYRTIRGRTIVAALCDEIAFWLSEDSANPDEEVLAAIRPAMATVPGAKLLCASSAYARRGALWNAFERWHGKEDAPVLVWRAGTRTMNATVPQKFIDDERERDPARASGEYDAEFRADIAKLLSREAIMACVETGTFERPPDRSHSYFGFVDPAGGSGGDSFTMAIGHKQGTTAILDLIRERPPPFSPEATVAELASTLKQYRVSMVTGDRYAGDWPAEQFRKNGIHLEPSDKTKSEIYGDAVAVINSGAVDLLDHPRLIAQLSNLERRTRAGGRDQIDHPPGGHDDVANAAMGCAVMCDRAGPSNFNRKIVYPRLSVA
jgi:hypothetical protein